jgi:hypothetical protein
VSCSKVNALNGWLLGKCLPPVHLAHGDLTGRKERPEQHGGSLCRGQYGLRLDATLELLMQPFDGIRNRYEDRGACSSGRDMLFWRMVRPSGTRGTGSTSVGRPIRTMSRELVLVAGRPCDRPGCAASADP